MTGRRGMGASSSTGGGTTTVAAGAGRVSAETTGAAGTIDSSVVDILFFFVFKTQEFFFGMKYITFYDFVFFGFELSFTIPLF
jgi:hypothetical protein